MTTLNLITLATVKTQLGISDTSDDTAIKDMIPIVSADVRRILNCQFDHVIPAEFNDTADTVEAVWGLPLGQVVYDTNLPADTYITGFDTTNLVYSISGTPTAEGTEMNLTVNIAQWPAISKMIWYKISKQSKSDALKTNVKSRSVGPLNVSFSDSEINKQYNYPQILIDDLGAAFADVG
jgi:hypothetical protein